MDSSVDIVLGVICGLAIICLPSIAAILGCFEKENLRFKIGACAVFPLTMAVGGAYCIGYFVAEMLARLAPTLRTWRNNIMEDRRHRSDTALGSPEIEKEGYR